MHTTQALPRIRQAQTRRHREAVYSVWASRFRSLKAFPAFFLPNVMLSRASLRTSAGATGSAFYSFFAYNQLVIAGIIRISGAKATITVTVALSSNGRRNVIIPIMATGIDHKINCRAPYSFILYQFSSDSNDFLNRTPYSLFILTLRWSKGIASIIASTATETRLKPRIMLVVFMFFLLQNIRLGVLMKKAKVASHDYLIYVAC